MMNILCMMMMCGHLRYEEERQQRELEALQSCTFAPAVNHGSPRLHAAASPVPLRPTSRPGTPSKASMHHMKGVSHCCAA